MTSKLAEWKGYTIPHLPKESCKLLKTAVERGHYIGMCHQLVCYEIVCEQCIFHNRSNYDTSFAYNEEFWERLKEFVDSKFFMAYTSL